MRANGSFKTREAAEFPFQCVFPGYKIISKRFVTGLRTERRIVWEHPLGQLVAVIRFRYPSAEGRER